MRRALIGMILAATVLTPVAADAQNWRNRGGDREQSQAGDRGEERSTRIEQRQQQREGRQAEQQQVQPQPQPQVQAQPQVEVVQRDRGNDGDRGNRGNWRGGGNDGNRGGNDGNRGNWRGRGNDGDGGNRGGRGDQGSIYPQAWQGDPNDPALRRYQRLERQNQESEGRRGDRRDDRQDWRRDRRDDRRDWRGDRRDDRRDWRGDWRGDRNDWNRGWRNDNRFNWQRYRYGNRNLFRGRPYYSPYRNYRYSRFSIGLFLDQAFYGQRYWIGDPWQYRLPPAPYGTQWVRYYNDVILVDTYTGEVVDVIYDFFW